MDVLGTSCYNLNLEENQKAILEQKKQDEKFSEIIVSCKSLSHYDGRTFKTLLPQILAAFLAASYHIVNGMALAFSAILVPALDPNKTEAIAEGEFTATKSESSWIASCIVLIIPIASPIAGLIIDGLGRLNTLRLAAVPSVLGWSLIASAQNVPMIIVGRLLTGLGMTLGTAPAVVYITEIARADMRGSLISSCPAYASLGMMMVFLQGWFIHWRTVAWLCNIYVIVACSLTFLIPESPAWLVAKGKIERAAKSLEWINKYQPQPENRNESLAELQLNQLQKEHQQKLEEQSHRSQSSGGILKEFLKPTGYKPILILCGLFFFQQFSGIYVTLFYQVTFFKEVKSEINPYLASMLIGLVRLAMSCINTYMLRTFRRRPLLIISGLGMAVCMSFSGLFTHWITEGTSSQSWVPVALLLLYVITSMIGLLPIPWTMTAELFPIEIRGVAHSFMYGAAHLLMFGAVQSYYALSDLCRGAAGVQWFFAAVSVLASAYVLVFLPETHGKKLADITDYFNDHTVFLGSEKEKRKQKKRVAPNRAANVDIVRVAGQNERLMDGA